MTDDQANAYPTQVAEVERVDEPSGEIPHTPQISLTFLLVSGRRRTMNFDPAYTVGRVKELVWNTWPGGSFSSSPVGLMYPSSFHQTGRTSDHLPRHS